MKLLEAPIGSWTVDPDIDANETEMVSKFSGYRQDQHHWHPIDKKAMRDPAVIEQARHAFRNTDATFNLYFWQSTDPDYDRTLEHGLADGQWLVSTLGADAAQRVVDVTTPDAITILMTNNLSDERHISIKSSWMIAHRLAHAMIGGGGSDQAEYILQAFKAYLRTIVSKGYGTPWPKSDGSTFDEMVNRDYWDAYGRIFGHHLGTMRSARQGHLVQSGEWIMETMAQYLITGDIRFNPLPDQIHPEEKLTVDPQVRARLAQETEKFRVRLKKLLKQMLDGAKGQVYVI